MKRSNGGSSGGAEDADDVVPFDRPVSGKRPMSLEGREALDLYLAKISRNATELQTQAARLQDALRERLELLRELQSSEQDDEKPRTG